MLAFAMISPMASVEWPRPFNLAGAFSMFKARAKPPFAANDVMPPPMALMAPSPSLPILANPWLVVLTSPSASPPPILVAAGCTLMPASCWRWRSARPSSWARCSTHVVASVDMASPPRGCSVRLSGDGARPVEVGAQCRLPMPVSSGSLRRVLCPGTSIGLGQPGFCRRLGFGPHEPAQRVFDAAQPPVGGIPCHAWIQCGGERGSCGSACGYEPQVVPDQQRGAELAQSQALGYKLVFEFVPMVVDQPQDCG